MQCSNLWRAQILVKHYAHQVVCCWQDRCISHLDFSLDQFSRAAVDQWNAHL